MFIEMINLYSLDKYFSSAGVAMVFNDENILSENNFFGNHIL